MVKRVPNEISTLPPGLVWNAWTSSISFCAFLAGYIVRTRLAYESCVVDFYVGGRLAEYVFRPWLAWSTRNVKSTRNTNEVVPLA